EQDINPLTEYVGHVEAIQTVDLQARISGFLEKIYFKEGSDVSAGSRLYLIEPAPYQTKVAINAARVAKGESAMKAARQHLERIQAVRSGGIPMTDIEAAQAAAEQAQAELQEARAMLDLSKIDLAYTQISAPITGRIGATSLSVGNMCGPASGALARIVQLDPVRVLFSISENDLGAIKAAQIDATNKKSAGLMRPRLRMADGTELENFGEIDFVDNQVDPTTGTIAVRALFDNPQKLLLPGQYVQVRVSQMETKTLPVVPQSAILEDRDGRYLLLVDEQSQVVQRRVTTGAVVGSFWAIETGLSAGERVIVQGVQKVRPGETVQTLTADAAGGSSKP
ncbi:MAG: efflux RND transporter periplasmic adaptor subunit, partial [Desulfuromonadales bacterium]|nr:efflux RND transporter periplasmic adaptor subunit [Desulfuromonadales bacterium]